MKLPTVRLAFALLLAMVPLGADAAQWLFVSPKGSDEGQCESLEKPCATIDIFSEAKKKRIAGPTKRCNHHRRIVAVCCPELGEFIQ